MRYQKPWTICRRNDILHEAQIRDFKISQKDAVLLVIKSKYVLTAALRPPGVASLPIFAGLDDPVGWLEAHLEVAFPENGEILAIGLAGTEEQSDDIKSVVDAVAKAYQDEVLELRGVVYTRRTSLFPKRLNELNEKIAERRTRPWPLPMKSRRNNAAYSTSRMSNASSSGPALPKVRLPRTRLLSTIPHHYL